MKTCPNCGTENNDNSAFCSNCGAPMNGQPAYQPPVKPSPWDHTAEFDEKDISENKIFALSCYALSVPGILIALLASPKSPYTAFHVREALKFVILNVVLGLVAGLLAWTVLAPIAAGILAVILLVVRAISFVDVCRGKALEPWLIRHLSFLK